MKLPALLLWAGLSFSSSGFVATPLKGAEVETKGTGAKEGGVIYRDAKHGFSLTLPAGVMRSEEGGVVAYTGFAVPKGMNLTEKSLVISYGEHDLIKDLATSEVEEEPQKGKLEFRMVMDGYEQVLAAKKLHPDDTVIRPEWETVPYQRGNGGAGAAEEKEEIIVAKKAEISGDKIKTARAESGRSGNWEISLTFNDEGRRQFAEVTARMAKAVIKESKHPMFAILLDGVAISAAGLTMEAAAQGGIKGGGVIISGRFNEKEAKEIAGALNAERERREEAKVRKTITFSSGGVEFRRVTAFDGSAGHMTMHVIYTWKDGAEDVNLDFMHRAVNVGNFDPADRPTEYDQAEEQKKTEEIVRTFRRGK